MATQNGKNTLRTFGTNMDLLEEFVPGIRERIKTEDSAVAREIRRRAVESKLGFRPFHWMRGCM